MAKPTPTSKKSAPPGEISPALIGTIASRLRDNRRVRRTLPVWGRVHVERQVPFLCVYRRTPGSVRLGMRNLVTSEAAYLYTQADHRSRPSIRDLTLAIADVMVDQFGAFLLLELWPAHFEEDKAEKVGERAICRPRFRIVTHHRDELGDFRDKFVESLSRIKIERRAAHVDVVSRARVAPPGLRPILPPETASAMGCLVLGLEVSPIFADPESDEVFPLVRRQMERQLTFALKRMFFEFARTRTTHRPPHYHALGRRATVKAVWKADRLLAEVSDQFDFLLQVSPINGNAAWRRFQRDRYRKRPTFHYRPLPVDPVLLKRRLFGTPLERVEDPAIGQLLRDKLLELDRQLGMLLDINKPQFVHGSIQLYGGAEDSLLATAEEILRRLPRSTKARAGETLDAHAFAALALEEIAYLREQDEAVDARVEVRSDVNGLLVSHGSLLVGAETSISRSRVDALLQHEIGTHVLTFYNGRAQPFRQLSAGLSGYEALQEGVAVLAEFLTGALDARRMRMLAARVVTVRRMIEGDTFLDCFHRLVEQHRFAARTAFNVVMRIFRGGGLTKDAVYLRGLQQALDYLGRGGDLEPLLLGKISTEHIPMMKELRWRKVLSAPKLTPRYMTNPDALARLDRLRYGMSVLDLIEPPKSRPARESNRNALDAMRSSGAEGSSRETTRRDGQL